MTILVELLALQQTGPTRSISESSPKEDQAACEMPMVPTVALFNFCTMILAGNAPLLIPLLIQYGTSGHDHQFTFKAAPVIGGSATDSGDNSLVPVTFHVMAQGAEPFEGAMILALCGLYILSGFLFIAIGVILQKFKQ